MQAIANGFVIFWSTEGNIYLQHSDEILRSVEWLEFLHFVYN